MYIADDFLIPSKDVEELLMKASPQANSVLDLWQLSTPPADDGFRTCTRCRARGTSSCKCMTVSSALAQSKWLKMVVSSSISYTFQSHALRLRLVFDSNSQSTAAIVGRR